KKLRSYGALLQRVLRNLSIYKGPRVVPTRGIVTAPLRKGYVFRAPSMQQPRETVVAFEAARLGIQSVLLVALSAELLLDFPRLRPHGRIFDRDLVGKGPWPGARPALDQVQVLARALIIGFRTEIGNVDDEGLALPAAARVAEPLTDVGWQVRAPV